MTKNHYAPSKVAGKMKNITNLVGCGPPESGPAEILRGSEPAEIQLGEGVFLLIFKNHYTSSKLRWQVK